MRYDDYNKMMAAWKAAGAKTYGLPHGEFHLDARDIGGWDRTHERVGEYKKAALAKAAAQNPWRGQLASHKSVSEKPVYRQKSLMHQGRAKQQLVRQTKAKMQQTKDTASMRKQAFIEGFLHMVKAAQQGSVLGSGAGLLPNVSPAQVRQPDQAVPTPQSYNNQIQGALSSFAGSQQPQQNTGGQMQLYQGLSASSGAPPAAKPKTGFSAPKGGGSAYSY